MTADVDTYLWNVLAAELPLFLIYFQDLGFVSARDIFVTRKDAI